MGHCTPASLLQPAIEEQTHLPRELVLPAGEEMIGPGDLDLTSILRGVDSGNGQIEILGPVIERAVKDVEAAHQ